MNSRITLLLLVTVLVLLSSGCPETERNDAFFFMVWADPQFGVTASNADWITEETNLRLAVEAANRLRPAFVVVCGDLVHATGDSAQIDAYRQTIGRLDRSIPLHQLPGNHDVGNTPEATMLSRYRASFGKDYYAFHHGFVHGIVLNTPMIKDSTLVRFDKSAQDTWLRAELAGIRRDLGGRVMIFQHQPWFVDSIDEADGYENLPAGSRRAYLSMFADAGVTHIFSGHLHRTLNRAYDSIRLVGCGPLTYPLGNDPPGVLIVVVHGRRVVERYFPLADIPQKAEDLW
jgi:serine/threonine-protein phosphatase CPPED1